MNNMMQPGCCCGSTPPPPCFGSIVVCAGACGHPANMGVTIVQTAGGSYTATMNGVSCLTFPGVPCGTYTVTINIRGAPPNVTTGVVITSGGSVTINKTITTPPGYVCACCLGNYFPATLFLTDNFGTISLTWDGSGCWNGSRTVTVTGVDATCTPASITVDITYGFCCSGFNTSAMPVSLSVSWIVQGQIFAGPSRVNGPGFCCSGPPPTLCWSGAMGPTGFSQPCPSPINGSFSFGPSCTPCGLTLGPVTVTE